MSAASRWQPGIIEPTTSVGRFLTFDLQGGADAKAAVRRLTDLPPGIVIGIGEPLALAMGAKIPGLRTFLGITGPGISMPSTQGALWAFVSGETGADVFDHARALRILLGADFRLREEVATFGYRGHDLSGFVDGTENPKDEKAIATAIVTGQGPGLDGSSFVGVQKWVHDLTGFAKRSQAERDNTIGRHELSNEEMEDAPKTAHVKRTAQESFDPEAFILRRSMPWGGVEESGLYFVAYVESLDRFERQLLRMVGREDGVVDALLSFSRPITGSYYWCPPVNSGGLNLSALGI